MPRICIVSKTPRFRTLTACSTVILFALAQSPAMSAELPTLGGLTMKTYVPPKTVPSAGETESEAAKFQAEQEKAEEAADASRERRRQTMAAIQQILEAYRETHRPCLLC